jgi:ligand-binding sensor domain-containing protein
MKLVVYTLLFWVAGLPAVFSQEYNYSHYDSRDGLGSATVYCMTQDKDGFLWFGTETGLSRFDGTHFRNFTQEDGLPDNEIIQIFADSKGRVWFAPWRKTVCYYYKGVIHNSDNDSLLKKLRISDNVYRFAEDRDGNILMQESAKLHFVQNNGTVGSIFSLGDKPLGYISLIAGRKEGGFLVLVDKDVYFLHENRFMFWKRLDYKMAHFGYTGFRNDMLAWRNNYDTLSLLSMADNKVQKFRFNYGKQNYNLAVLDNRYIGVSLQIGALVYDKENADSIRQYLPDVVVSNMMKDSEGSLWFTTLGKGVYRLNSAVVLNVRNPVSKPEDFLAGAMRSKDYDLSKKTWEVFRQYAPKGALPGRPAFTWYNSTPRLNIISWNDDLVIVGTSGSIFKLKPPFAQFPNIQRQLFFVAVKALCRHKNTLLVATDKNVMVLDPLQFKMLDTIWHERATCVYSNNDTVFIGTLSGLYRITPDKQVQYLGEKIKALQGRIAGVQEDANHVIWVATSGFGLIGLRNGEPIEHITRKNGLLSNFCRTLFYGNGNLWVGTDKGLCKVSVLQPGYPIDKYTISDGLASDIINTVYETDKKVFVGTPEGITIFEEDKIASQSQCVLRFVDIAVAGKSYYPDNVPASIPHEKNSIAFNYVGISFKSNGDIRYRYRLAGLDSVWQETRETFLNYPTLPSGDYELQLQAVNKFDVSSQVLTVPFTIEKMLYEKTWFRILLGLLFLAVTGLVVSLIVRRIRRREREKADISKRISELEQLSRKAQMNPHFIFNSLNSIQQYVMDADLAGANKFISGFSRLIRQTLDFSSKPEISLEEELDYLTNYLDLEKTRLENSFAWSVFVDEEVDPTEYYIPPMILQPFVENSVRHGLRFRRDKNGIVTITVKRAGDHLVCILEDNGIGRKAAMKYKSISPINYQSKGLSLTADRITMFNKEHELKITMQIDDLEDDDHRALGTRVTINFPVQ